MPPDFARCVVCTSVLSARFGINVARLAGLRLCDRASTVSKLFAACFDHADDPGDVLAAMGVPGPPAAPAAAATAAAVASHDVSAAAEQQRRQEQQVLARKRLKTALCRRAFFGVVKGTLTAPQLAALQRQAKAAL